MGARLTSVRTLEHRSRRPPLIGITTSELRRREQVTLKPHGEPGQRSLTLGLDYAEAVARAGGVPIIITPVGLADLPVLLARLDAVVLSGGPDLDPATYGQSPHSELGPTEPSADAFELALCREAMTAGTPLFGICRGMQVLNVACGGTLHQHLPDIAGEAIAHRQAQAGLAAATHEAVIVEGTRLAGIVGPAPLEVNSFHHQAVDRLGTSLRVAAHAPDGIVEAVESIGEEMLFGVQWHLESLMDDARHADLLMDFVDAARSAGDRIPRQDQHGLAETVAGRLAV